MKKQKIGAQGPQKMHFWGPWDPRGVSPGDPRRPFGPIGPGPWADGPWAMSRWALWADWPFGPGAHGPRAMGPGTRNEYNVNILHVGNLFNILQKKPS